jgi:hypothetical protein
MTAAKVALSPMTALTPGVGGNILYLIASFVDLYFVLPGMIAVVAFWVVLRNAPRSTS